MSEYTLDILGRTLTVVNASQGLIAWLEEHWNFPEHAGQLESDWTFVLEYSDEPEPEGLREQAKPLEGSFNPLEVAWAEDGSVWLLERQGGVRLALEQDAHRVGLHWYGTLEYADALILEDDLVVVRICFDWVEAHQVSMTACFSPAEASDADSAKIGLST